MSSKKTKYLNMHDWIGTDPWRRSEISENFQKLDDKALKLDDSMAAATATAGQAKATAEGINAKAESALTNSTSAVTNANAAVQTASAADTKATVAKTTAEDALTKAQSADATAASVQNQFDQVIINGDSSIEAAQARVDTSGQTYTTLKQRLDSEHQSTTSLLAETAKVAYVDTKVAAVASGAPKGTYATLTALQTELPSGNGNIYLVTADGKWYYWNGSAWTAGGLYQSTGIAEKAVAPKNTNFVQFSSNLLDSDSMVAGDFSSTTGAFIESSANFISGFIEVDPSISYSTKGIWKIGRYTADKTFTNAHNPNEVDGSSWTTTSATKYVRVVAKNSLRYEAQLNKGNEILGFEPYFTKIDQSKLEVERNKDDKVIVVGTKYNRTIQSAIDSLPADGGVVYIPPGIWKINQPIKIPSNVTLMGAGNSTKIVLQQNSNCDLIRNADLVNGNKNIIIRDLYLDGDGDNQAITGNAEVGTDQYLCGVRLHRSSDSLIENVWAYNIGYAVDWSTHARGMGILVNRSHDITIRGCNTQRSGYEGIGVRGEINYPCYRIIISDCKSWDNKQHGMQIAPDTGFQRVDEVTYDVSISNFIAWNNNTNGIIIGHGSHDVTITGGMFKNKSGGTGVYVYDSSHHVTVQGSTFIDTSVVINKSPEGGICHHVAVNGCIFRQTSNLVGTESRVFTSGSGQYNLTVSGCVFEGYSTSLPFVQTVLEHSSIQGNSMNCKTKAANSIPGIRVDGSRSTVTGNVIAKTGRGIWVRESTDSVLSDNNIIDVNHEGILLNGTTIVPNNCIISSNKISSGYPAIDANVGDYHIISGNIAQSSAVTKIKTIGANVLKVNNIEIV